MHMPQTETDQNGTECRVTVSFSHPYPVPQRHTRFLGIFPGNVYTRTHTPTHKLMDIFHIKVHFLSSTVYWAQVTRKSHGVRGGGEGLILSQIQTHNLSPWLWFLPVPIHPEYAARAIFLKYCFPSCPCPESMMFPIVCSKVSLPNFQSFSSSSSMLTIQILMKYYYYKS